MAPLSAKAPPKLHLNFSAPQFPTSIPHQAKEKESTMEPLTSAPETSAFVSLSVHQSRTPDSFHSGPAVLHYHATNCKLVGLEHDLSSTPALNTLRGAEVNGSNSSPENLQSNDANGGEGETEKEVVIEGLDVWVTSEYVADTFYNSNSIIDWLIITDEQ